MARLPKDAEGRDGNGGGIGIVVGHAEGKTANAAPLREGASFTVQRHAAMAAGRSANLDSCPVVPANIGPQRLDDSFLRSKTRGESRRSRLPVGCQAIR